jgi:hypothetical protein
MPQTDDIRAVFSFPARRVETTNAAFKAALLLKLPVRIVCSRQQVPAEFRRGLLDPCVT